MMTDRDIQDLIQLPKIIGSKTPSAGYKEENGHRRCELDLQAMSDDDITFAVFIRQNNRFIENFSIGLRYHTGDKALGTITLVRYNGPHGESRAQTDGHYAKPHIHRITEAEIASGSRQPQESYREITDKYSTFEQALHIFFEDTAVSNHADYFPDTLQMRLFNGHQ